MRTDAGDEGRPDDALTPVVRDRRSRVAFAPEALPADVERRLFEAARWAPSGGNGQPWRFVVTRRGTPGFDALAASLRPGNAWATAAPLLVLALVRTVHVHPEKPPKRNRHALLDLGLAIGNLVAQATADGVAAHAMGGFDREVAAEATGVRAPWDVGVLLALGWPGDPAALPDDVAAKEAGPRVRLPLDAIVVEDRFDPTEGVPDPAPASETDAGATTSQRRGGADG